MSRGRAAAIACVEVVTLNYRTIDTANESLVLLAESSTDEVQNMVRDAALIAQASSGDLYLQLGLSYPRSDMSE